MVYRQQVERLQDALNQPDICDEASPDPPLRSRVCFDWPGQKRTGDGNRRRDRENGRARHWKQAKRATLDEETARSVKVVAGRGFEPLTFRS